MMKCQIRPRPINLSMARWDAKMKSGSEYMSPIMLDTLPVVRAFVTLFRCTQNAFVTKAKQVLSSAGVSVLQGGPYLAFANEVWSIPFTGETAAIEAEAIIVKWVARGLTRSVLEDIRTGVFNISAPSSP